MGEKLFVVCFDYKYWSQAAMDALFARITLKFMRLIRELRGYIVHCYRQGGYRSLG